jgi:hypothetical protein
VDPIVVEYSWPAVCDGAISSPSGDVALGTHSFLNAPPVAGFGLFTRDGTRLGAAAPTLPPGPVVDPFFHPAAGGFQGVAAMSTGLQCAAWDRSGALEVIACPGHPVTSAPTAAGGTVFVVAPAAGGDQLLVRVDPQGNASTAHALGGAASLVLESWRSAHVVVVDLSGATARARWFDENGNALTAWFTLKARTPGYGASLKLLVDGTVAVYDGAGWTAVLRDGVEAADDPPAWLARLSGARLATIRQGRGYAVLRDDPGGAATFEVVTPDGQSCGNVTLPAKDVRRLDCGYDGTLFAVEARPALGGTPGGCGFRWWRALLR